MEWPATLNKLGELGFQRILPGHGVVQPDRSRMLQMRAYIEELTALVVEGKRAGRSLRELQQSITARTLHSIANGGYGGYAAANEGRFRFRAPGSDPWEIVEGGVRANISAIYAKAANPG
jgi:hypothetical protein